MARKRGVRRPPGQPEKASMEPRQQWRGNEKGLEGRKMTTISFNGAAPTMARKLGGLGW